MLEDLYLIEAVSSCVSYPLSGERETMPLETVCLRHGRLRRTDRVTNEIKNLMQTFVSADGFGFRAATSPLLGEKALFSPPSSARWKYRGERNRDTGKREAK